MKKPFTIHYTVWVTVALLRSLKVKINNLTVKGILESHPDFPSLSAISDCLHEFNVPNQSYQIILEEYDPEDLLFPFIAYLPEKNGSFVIVKSIVDGTVNLLVEDNQHHQLSEKEFLTRWKGVALHAQASEKSVEADYFKNRFKHFSNYFTPLFMLVLLLGVSYSAFKESNLSAWFLGVIIAKLAGLTVSVLLLIQSINSNNPLILNLCSLGGKNNCNDLLKSEASKVNSWLNWSEVGFFYFSGSLLSLIVLPESVELISWLSALALPYTIYSISYQYRTKNWCILCCGVQMVIWTEFTLVNAGSFFRNSIVLTNLSLIFLCFCIPVVAWIFLKPFFLIATQNKQLQKQLKKFKYNNNLFNQALTSQPKYIIHNDLKPIVLGNPDGENVITIVSNPFCGPCAAAHKTLDEWLQKRADIKLNVIFSTSNQDDDKRTVVARHISALSLVDDKQVVGNALSEWYKGLGSGYEKWAAKYPVNLNEEANEVTQKQKTWCEMADIKFTPTILINGFKIPEPYLLEDIKYLI